MEDKTLREKMEEIGLTLLEKSESMKPGSEEHSRTIEDVVKISRACDENYRTEVNAYNDSLRIENEILVNDKEAETNRVRVDVEELKLRRVKADTKFTMAGIALITIGGVVYEVTGGRIIPGKLWQLVSYIPKSIKL